jgi:hypothetical protein
MKIKNKKNSKFTQKIFVKKLVTRKVGNNKYKNMKNTKNTKNMKNTKNGKKYTFNKYENTKVVGKFNLIKMPYINTSFIDSKYLLHPLKNIQNNKDSVDNENSLREQYENMEKIVKQNGISPKKDFYTYVNFAWMKQQDIVMDYKNYYFINYLKFF